MNPKKVYLAGPLFTLAERNQNLRLLAALQTRAPDVVFVLPQLEADKYLPNLQAVAMDCYQQVKNADVVMACLDGPDADSGTCAEVGYAYALGKPVIGYRTDFRGSEIDGVNAMLRYSCVAYVVLPAYQASLESLADRLIAELNQLA